MAAPGAGPDARGGRGRGGGEERGVVGERGAVGDAREELGLESRVVVAEARVAIELQCGELAEEGGVEGDGAREVVLAEIQVAQGPHVADVGQDGAVELVVAEVQMRAVVEQGEGSGDGAGELVARQIDVLQLGEVAEDVGEESLDLVVAEVQVRELGQVAHLRGQGPADGVAGHIDVLHACWPRLPGQHSRKVHPRDHEMRHRLHALRDDVQPARAHLHIRHHDLLQIGQLRQPLARQLGRLLVRACLAQARCADERCQRLHQNRRHVHGLHGAILKLEAL